MAKIDFEDVVCAVTIGPKSYQSVYDLRSYIENLGYRKIAKRTIKSKCPLR